MTAETDKQDWFLKFLERIDTDLSTVKCKLDRLAILPEKVEGLERYIETKFHDQSLAVEMARATMDKRLDGMNEFRDALKDQSSKMMTRDEYAIAHEKFRDELAVLTKAKERMEGKASQTSFYITAAIAIISLVLGAIHVFRDLVR